MPDLIPPELLPYFPPEYWELVELTCAGCPPLALKAFRKSVIGRGKRLRAAGADNAIRAAKLHVTGSDKVPSDLLGLADTIEDKINRNEWYRGNGWPIVLVRAAGEPWPQELVRYVGELPLDQAYTITRLEYDAENVDRIAA